MSITCSSYARSLLCHHAPNTETAPKLAEPTGGLQNLRSMDIVHDDLRSARSINFFP